MVDVLQGAVPFRLVALYRKFFQTLNKERSAHEEEKHGKTIRLKQTVNHEIRQVRVSDQPRWRPVWCRNCNIQLNNSWRFHTKTPPASCIMLHPQRSVPSELAMCGFARALDLVALFTAVINWFEHEEIQ